MTQELLTRRRLLLSSAKKTAQATAAGVLGVPLLGASPITVTPTQTEGPFYPVNPQLDKDADMTQVAGRSEKAQGEVIFLEGKVLHAATREPIEGALVEFWQACASGRYQHPDDPNNAPLDPNFQYWAQVRTDAQGLFAVKTIVPGAYPAGEGWLRPPHIHVKVHAQGFPSLTTQMYFEGHPLNKKDFILQRLSSQKRSLVTVRFVEGKLASPWEIYLLPRKFQMENQNMASSQITITPEM